MATPPISPSKPILKRRICTCPKTIRTQKFTCRTVGRPAERRKSTRCRFAEDGQAANEPELKEAFEQTSSTDQRPRRSPARTAFQLLGDPAEAKTCKAMKGIIEEGQETIDEAEDKDELTADLSLIAAAQRVEHYEISGYGNARCLAQPNR